MNLFLNQWTINSYYYPWKFNKKNAPIRLDSHENSLKTFRLVIQLSSPFSWLPQNFFYFSSPSGFRFTKMQIERHASSETGDNKLNFCFKGKESTNSWKKTANEISCFHKLKHFSLNLRREFRKKIKKGN